MKKEARQKIILDVILHNDVDTQERLTELLKDRGVITTQATISRDIRELGIVKISVSDSTVRYSLPLRETENKRFRTIFSDAVTDVDYALNTVVIKCRGGMAQAVCAALDAVEFEGIVGTIAGDDTIFVLMRTERSAAEFSAGIRKIMNKNG